MTTTTTTAPAPTFTAETLRVYAIDVHNGDAVNGRTVADYRIGTKFVTILDADGKTITRTEKDSMITVTRQIETEESKAARAHAARLDSYEWIIRMAEKRYRDATNAMIEAAAQSRVSYSHMSELAAAQAEHNIWQAIAASVENGHTADLHEAVTYYAAELTGEILRAATYGNSRSTNQMSNVLDDITNEARANFVRRYGPNRTF